MFLITACVILLTPKGYKIRVYDFQAACIIAEKSDVSREQQYQYTKKSERNELTPLPSFYKS